MRPFVEAVLSTIERYRMCAKNATIVVAVSGGPDSVALLNSLEEIHEELRPTWHLHVAHFKHLIRPVEGEEDARFVAHLCRALSVPYTEGQADIPRMAEEEKANVEAIARRERYRFLLAVAKETGATHIATGHTASDQAETVLFRATRGTSVAGLAGIAPFRREAGRRIIRPLIERTRQEIESYLSELGQSFRSDSTNADLDYRRNAIRGELIPWLQEKINPRAVEALACLAESARDAQEIQQWAVRVVLNNAEEGDTLRLAGLEAVPPSLQRAVIVAFLRRRGVRMGAVTRAHVLRIADCLEKKSGRVSLPGSVLAEVRDGLLSVKTLRGAVSVNTREKARPVSVQVPGVTDCEPWDARLVVDLWKDAPDLSDDRFEEFIDADRIAHRLTLRAPRPGDSFVPLGMKHRKKLQDFFVDLKVPKQRRAEIPLLLSDDEIVWVVGYRLSECFKVGPRTRRIFRLKWERVE